MTLKCSAGRKPIEAKSACRLCVRPAEVIMNMPAAFRIAMKRNVPAIIMSLVVLFQPGQGIAQQSRKSTLTAEQIGTLELDGISGWLRARFSAQELESLSPGDLTMESHFCGCTDVPKKHFPSAFVVLSTPKGDLLARPDGHEAVVHFTALAVRRDLLYCDPEAEASCYGSFAHPCEFTDFRYGPQLARFFPTCKTE